MRISQLYAPIEKAAGTVNFTSPAAFLLSCDHPAIALFANGNGVGDRFYFPTVSVLLITQFLTYCEPD